MKKILVVLLALVAFGGLAFAEDAAPVASINGYVYNSAVLYDQAGFQSLGPNWLSAGNYTNLTLKLDGKIYGFNANWEFENTAINTAWRDYTAWVKPFGDRAKFSVGKLRNGDYRLTSYVDGSGFNSRLANAEYGLLVQVYPMAGLSAGIFNAIPATAAKLDTKNIGVGASYSIPDLAKVVVMYKQSNDEMFVGADIKAVKDLTAKVGLTLDTTSGSSFTKVWATAGYALMDGALDVGVDAYFNMATTTTIWAKVQGTYTVAAIPVTVYVDLKNAAATTEDFGVSAKFAAGSGGALYVGVDVSNGTALTWSLPVAVEIAW